MVRSHLSSWRRLGAATVIAAMLLAGCDDLAPVMEIEQPVEPGQVSLRPLLDSDSLALPGVGTGDVIETLGEPTSTETAEPPKEERPGTISTLRYQGLDVVVHELEKPRRTFISELVISSPMYLTDLDIGIGSSRAEVEQVLGAPSSTEGDETVYDLTDAGDRCTVTYDRSRATRFAFRFSWR
jgi:hypothetical protein